MASIFEKIKGFMNRGHPTFAYQMDTNRWSSGYYGLGIGNSKSITNNIYNRIAVDVSQINIQHVEIDDNGKYVKTLDTPLNYALTMSSNIDQTGRELIREVAMQILTEGYVAIIPVIFDGTKIYELRIGKIINWYNKEITVSIYDDTDGYNKEITLPKDMCAIIENPFYYIMNESNSTLKRLNRVLNQLDQTNSTNSSNKLDLILQLPYTAKSKLRRDQAESRRKEMENQLANSEYGIAYTDGTERVIQLNRSVTNNLWEQSRVLQKDLYNQLGLSESIFDRTADEKTTLNYQNTCLVPILTAITEEMTRKFIPRNKKDESIMFFLDPFKLIPVTQLAEMSDKLTRNEILTSNEVRSTIGYRPSDDPRADQLRNSNLSHPEDNKQY